MLYEYSIVQKMSITIIPYPLILTLTLQMIAICGDVIKILT